MSRLPDVPYDTGVYCFLSIHWSKTSLNLRYLPSKSSTIPSFFSDIKRHLTLPKPSSSMSREVSRKFGFGTFFHLSSKSRKGPQDLGLKPAQSCFYSIKIQTAKCAQARSLG